MLLFFCKALFYPCECAGSRFDGCLDYFVTGSHSSAWWRWKTKRLHPSIDDRYKKFSGMMFKKKKKKKLFLNVRMKKMSWAVCNQMCNEFHKLVWIRVCRTSWRACAGTLSFHSNLLLEQRQQRQETQCCCFYKPERCGRSCLPFSFFSFVSNFTISDCISILNDPFCSASASESYHLRGRTYRDVHLSRSLSV